MQDGAQENEVWKQAAAFRTSYLLCSPGPKSLSKTMATACSSPYSFPALCRSRQKSSSHIINPTCTCIDQLSYVPRAGPVIRQERGHTYGSPLQRQNCVEDKVTATLNTKMSLRAHETVLYINLDMAVTILKNAASIAFSLFSVERQVALSLQRRSPTRVF